MKPKLDWAWAIGLVVSLAVGPAGLSAWSLGLGLVKGSKPTLTFFYFLSFPFGRPVFLSFFHLFSPLLFSSVFLCFSSASGFFFYSVSFFFLFFIFFSWPVRPTIGSCRCCWAPRIGHGGIVKRRRRRAKTARGCRVRRGPMDQLGSRRNGRDGVVAGHGGD